MSTPAQTARVDAALERVLREFEAALARLPDGVAPRAARRRAAEQLRRLGWPQTRDEQWRYANLRAFDALAAFTPAALRAGAARARLPEELSLPPPLPGFARSVFLDGLRCEDRESPPGARTIHTAAPAGTLPFPVSSEAWGPEQRLALLTDMFALDAAVLRVAGEAAIEVLFVNGERAGGAAVYPRLQIELAPAARLTLIERHLGAPPSPALCCATVTAELARGSQLTHYRLQETGSQVLFTDALSARLQEQAVYQVRSLGLGALGARTSASVQLAGRGARLGWQAIAVGRGTQVHDTALKVQHAAEATHTDEVFRGIAEEGARVCFAGHIHVESAARGAEARQSLRGLVEGAAELDLRPRLQIDVDEVSAQHGATTGRLDEQLLFYLLSRGIERDTARALLKWAFLGDVLRAIELPALRAQAERSAAGPLPDVLAAGALQPATGTAAGTVPGVAP